jgi:hypothetical protein
MTILRLLGREIRRRWLRWHASQLDVSACDSDYLMRKFALPLADLRKP